MENQHFNKNLQIPQLYLKICFLHHWIQLLEKLYNNFQFLIVDTVGFIRDLPTTLIDAFKSTLDEIVYSDLILHVQDISNKYFLEQKNEVIKILDEIGVEDSDNRIIEVVNKIDLSKNLDNFHNSLNKTTIFTSALKGKGINNLKSVIYNRFLNQNIN